MQSGSLLRERSKEPLPLLQSPFTTRPGRSGLYAYSLFPCILGELNSWGTYPSELLKTIRVRVCVSTIEDQSGSLLRERSKEPLPLLQSHFATRPGRSGLQACSWLRLLALYYFVLTMARLLFLLCTPLLVHQSIFNTTQVI